MRHSCRVVSCLEVFGGRGEEEGEEGVRDGKKERVIDFQNNQISPQHAASEDRLWG